MSATRGKSIQARGLDALSLLVIVGILYVATRMAPGRRDTATVVGGLGFLLLAGTLTSQLLELLRLPHLTGYLLAGVVAGPHALQLVDAITVRQLAPVNTLALALIALAGGAELSAAEVRRSAKSLAVNLVFQSVIVVVGVGGLFVLASPLIPFARGLPLPSVVAIGLLWGVLATARSPSAALGILAQTRARGPLASFSVAFVMLSDVGVLVLAAAGILIAHSLLDPGATLSMSAMSGLGHELIGSVSIGTSLGLLLAVYLRLHGRQLIVLLLALGFGATEVLHYLRFEPLLCFLTAGFVVRNLSKQGDKLAHAIEDMGSSVYVVFFAIAGASLAIPLLVALWPIALLLAVARAAITTGAGRLAGRIARDDPMVCRWGWTTLIAQAGLTQGLANVLARDFPDFGEPLRALVFASVAVNSIVGPIFFKVALDRAKESREPSHALTANGEPT